MTTRGWPQADPALERAYRRLLRAYPGSYRRRHEREIVTTLLEMAAPGQRRPRAAEVWHLVSSGIRQRFRLPAANPLAWLVAVFALLIGGGVGAAAGSWVAEQTFADLPERAEVQALVNDLVPGRTRDVMIIDDELSPWLGGMTFAGTGVSGLDGWDSRQARQRLIAGGWEVGPTMPLGGNAPAENGQWVDLTGNGVEQWVDLTVNGVEFRAERDGVTLSVMSSLTERTGHIDAQLWPTGNASLVPLIVAGGLAGMAAGWLVAASAVRRLLRTGTVHRWGAGLLAAMAVPVLALPVVAFYGNVMRVFQPAGNGDPVFTVHSALSPGAYWPFGPGWLNLMLFGAGAVLAVGALVVAWMRPVVGADARTVAN